MSENKRRDARATPASQPAKARPGTAGVSYEDLARRVRARLRDHRLERGLSLQQAAELSGFSRNGIEKVEDGDVQPTLETLLRLSAFYGEPLPQFFTHVYGEAKLADAVRGRLQARAVEEAEQRRVFLELAQKLGYAPFLARLDALKDLAEKTPETYHAIAAVLDALHSGVPRVRGEGRTAKKEGAGHRRPGR